MKILFLDIDGVLNSSQFYQNKTNSQLLKEPFDRSCAGFVKMIVDQTGAVIVLTSTWRGGWEKEAERCTLEGHLLNDLFSSLGLTVFDKTEVLPGGRAAEILKYLKDCPETVSSYVIIDDNDFHWKRYGLSRHVVQTDFADGGLKELHAKRAIAVLNHRR